MAKSDIEIAREATLEPITEIAEKLNIPAEGLLPFGHDKAKLTTDFINSVQGNKDGKLILVTAISPTPAGEGKTKLRLVHEAITAWYDNHEQGWAMILAKLDARISGGLRQ